MALSTSVAVWRQRPDGFLSSIYSSARRMTDETSCSSGDELAIPTLHPRPGIHHCDWLRCSVVSVDNRAATVPANLASLSGSTTRNSSPPHRETVVSSGGRRGELSGEQSENFVPSFVPVHRSPQLFLDLSDRSSYNYRY